MAGLMKRLKVSPALRKGTQGEHRSFSPDRPMSTLPAVAPLAQHGAVGML